MNRIAIQSARKPIKDPYCRRSAYYNPEFLDIDALMKRFEPLFHSIHHRFCSYYGVYDQPDDTSDLYSQILLEFVALVRAYDPQRGVDFPGYIKFHLPQRIYNYVTKHQRQVNNEMLPRSIVSKDGGEVVLDSSLQEDSYTPARFEHVEAVESVPWESLTDLERELVTQILINHRSAEEVAALRHTSTRVINAQVDSLCSKLYELEDGMACESMNDMESNVPFVRKPITDPKEETHE